MGAIHGQRAQFVAAASEIVGYKSGLALALEEMSRLVPEYDGLWLGDGSDGIRMRSEEFEDAILKLLHRVGNISSDSPFPLIDLYHWHRQAGKGELLLKVQSRVMEWLSKRLQEGPDGPKLLNPTPILEQIHDQLGVEAALLATDVLKTMNDHLHRSPWGQVRYLEWADEAELRDLFASESLEPTYGKFIDQRFIDYLAQNFDDIDRMNWRKFEGLTGEFFDRQGYQVELGPGRDDDGIDARIWLPNGDKTLPPLILVQCKRTKDKVGKMVVKSLYADILEEGARSGIVVTSSALSPGAAKVCRARAYPVTSVERPTLREWINAMKSVGKGVFMGE